MTVLRLVNKLGSDLSDFTRGMGRTLKKSINRIGLGLSDAIAYVRSIFMVKRSSVKTVRINEGLIDMLSRIRYIKDDILDLIRIEDKVCTTKYDILEYQKEIDDLRIAALESLSTRNYTGRTQFLLINKILVDTSEVMELINRLVLMNDTDVDIKRTCLTCVGELI